mmetsp:Transcript_14369/g.24463  ORF Transcript_14369/g.24463 Transcript_14369/m.24463 type:complete len:154 (+) Transcript_14369:397-858(+)
MRAQAPYLTMSMKEIAETYTGPPKYLTQRDAPLEIPSEVVKKLFIAMDNDKDDRINLEELVYYAKLTKIPISDDIIDEMFTDAAKDRGIIHEHQKYQGLTFQEIVYAVRGRFSFSVQDGWSVAYKPYRDYWILFLLTVSERIFALQVPKVVPG